MAKSRIQTGLKKEYEDIRKWNPNYNNTVMFHIAAAIGLKEGKKVKKITGKKKDLINVPEVDTSKYLRSLLIAIEPEFAGKDYDSPELFTELEKYAEYGLKTLHNELMENGTISLKKYIPKTANRKIKAKNS